MARTRNKENHKESASKKPLPHQHQGSEARLAARAIVVKVIKCSKKAGREIENRGACGDRHRLTPWRKGVK